MSSSTNELHALASEQRARLIEAQRHLAVRDGIDQRRGAAQRDAQRQKLEMITHFDAKPKGEIQMAAIRRPSLFSTRLPRSGNAALWGSALIQAVLGFEFILSSLNKLADPNYVRDFSAFVRSTPGAASGVLSSLVQALVLPNIAFFARLIEISELAIGVVLLIGAAEIGRRRFAGRLGAQHGYESKIALASAAAGLGAAGLTLTIGMLMGEGFPTVAVGRAFTSAIPIELFIVPLGVAITWLELGRFKALRKESRPVAAIRSRRNRQPQSARGQSADHGVRPSRLRRESWLGNRSAKHLANP